jgi:hypothetical protein
MKRQEKNNVTKIHRYKKTRIKEYKETKIQRDRKQGDKETRR